MERFNYSFKLDCQSTRNKGDGTVSIILNDVVPYSTKSYKYY